MLRSLASRSAWLGLALSLAACGSVAPGGDGAVGESSATLSTRPATVPADYVRVPNGYAHQSCVVTLQPGQRYAHDAIIAADGSEQPLAPCTHERYDRRGARLTSNAPASIYDVDLSEDASATASAVGLTWLSTTVVVPPTPTNSGDWDNVNIAIDLDSTRPNGGASFLLFWDGKSWTASTDYYGPNNLIVRSPAVTVKPGDSIGAYLSGAGTSNWVTGINVNGGYATGMQFTPVQPFVTQDVHVGNDYTQAAGCAAFPATRSETFQVSSIINGAWASPAWTTNISRGPGANCLTAVTTTPTSVNIAWNAVLPPPPPPPTCTATPRICCTKPYLPGC